MQILLFLAEQWLLVSILVALGAGLFFVESRRAGQVINHHEMTRLINAGSAVVVDVRAKNEFKAGHIADAINLPHTKMSEADATLKAHKDKTIILVDKIGQHTGSAGRTLRLAGFDVRRLQGGITEWQGQQLPLVKA